MALSRRQEVWLEEYFTTWNATEAARRAGYAHPKASGAENLANPTITETIKTRLSERTMTADEALVRLAEQARAEYSAYLLDDGSVDLVAMKADGKMHLIKSIKPTKFGKVVEFHDAQTALVHIGRHHKLFVDRTDLSGGVEITDDREAFERILGRVDSLAARLGAQGPIAGNSADEGGAKAP